MSSSENDRLTDPRFVVDPSDYIGETVTAEPYEGRHRRAGRLARKPSTPDAYRYAGRHQWSAGRHQRAPWGTER